MTQRTRFCHSRARGNPLHKALRVLYLNDIFLIAQPRMKSHLTCSGAEGQRWETGLYPRGNNSSYKSFHSELLYSISSILHFLQDFLCAGRDILITQPNCQERIDKVILCDVQFSICSVISSATAGSESKEQLVKPVADEDAPRLDSARRNPKLS